MPNKSLHQLSLQGGQTKTGTCEAPRIWATGLSQTPLMYSLSLDALCRDSFSTVVDLHLMYFDFAKGRSSWSRKWMQG